LNTNIFYAESFLQDSAIFTFYELSLRILQFCALPSLCVEAHNDGFGEGFEQRDIKIDRGELNVSLWSYEDEFYIVTERVFRQRLGLETERPEAPTPAQAALYEPDAWVVRGAASAGQLLFVKAGRDAEARREPRLLLGP